MAATGKGKSRISEGSGPDPIDVHVGARLKLRRKAAGLAQGDLAEAIGVTFQQVQKYESGGNRISMSRLYDISIVLGVPPQFFFEDVPDDLHRRRLAAIPARWRPQFKQGLKLVQDDPMRSAIALRLFNAFERMGEHAREPLVRFLEEAVRHPKE